MIQVNKNFAIKQQGINLPSTVIKAGSTLSIGTITASTELIIAYLGVHLISWLNTYEIVSKQSSYLNAIQLGIYSTDGYASAKGDPILKIGLDFPSYNFISKTNISVVGENFDIIVTNNTVSTDALICATGNMVVS